MQKIYCFVDESGQDTLGSFFVVVTLVVKNNKDEMKILVEELENKTGKNNTKWNKSLHSKRMNFINKLFENKGIKGNLFYTQNQGIGYDSFTILSIAKVVSKIRSKQNQKVAIYVDGLTKTKATNYGSELRKIGVKNCKVKGVRKDENNVYIRIVDSVAGFIRLALYKKDADCKKIFNSVTRAKILVEI